MAGLVVAVRLLLVEGCWKGEEVDQWWGVGSDRWGGGGGGGWRGGEEGGGGGWWSGRRVVVVVLEGGGGRWVGWLVGGSRMVSQSIAWQAVGGCWRLMLPRKGQASFHSAKPNVYMSQGIGLQRWSRSFLPYRG